MLIHILDLAGTAVFAMAGALAAGRKQMDLFGAVVLGLATALGGGTIRDVTLSIHPVFWVADPIYIIVATAAALVAFFAARQVTGRGRWLMVADAFGLALFTVIGTQKAMSVGAPATICVIMGMMTGVAGGMIRDVLAGEIPLILRREIYATASLAGAVAYAVLSVWCPDAPCAIVPAMLVTLGLRLAAIRWNLSLPVFPSAPPPDGAAK